MLLAIPTKNRTASLRRCVESLRDNAKTYGRDVEFLVSDDSNESNAATNHSALKDLGVRFTHYDRGFKAQYAKELAAKSGISPHITRFAILPNILTAMGAARNFLTLSSIGQKLVMVDDDMVCKFAPVPNRRDKIVWALGPIIGDQEEIPAEVREDELVDEDFLAQHERLLGLRGVALTIGGSVGDSGAGNAYHMLTSRGILPRLDSPAALESLLVRRELFRVSPSPRIVRWPICTGMSVGLDARSPLPPFCPILRSEDVLFGLMLQNCFGRPSAYCNYAMWHTAKRSSTLKRDIANLAVPSFGDFIVQTLVCFNPQSLEEFGRVLVEASKTTGFEYFVERIIAAWREKFIVALAKRSIGLPDFLVRELKRLEEAVCSAPPYVTPSDLPVEEFRLRVRQVGELFLAWPALFEAAKHE